MSKSEASNDLNGRTQGIVEFLEVVQKLLTAFFIFTLPIIFYVFNTDMSYPKVIYSFGMISLLLFLWGIQSWLKGEFRVHLPILFWPSLLLILAAIASAINATSVGTVLQSLAVLVYFVLFYLYVANTAKDTRTFYFYFGAAMLAMFPIAVYVLLQKYAIVKGGNINTLIGTLGNPVAVAQYLDSILIVGILLFIGRVSGWMKVLLLAAFGAGFGTFFATNTTGPLLSLLMALVVFGVGLMLFRKTLKPLADIKGWLLATVVLIVAGLVFVAQPRWLPIRLGELPKAQAVALSEEDAPLHQMNTAALMLPIYKQIDYLFELWQENSGDLRGYYWLVGLEMFKDQPLFGIGLGHYKVKYGDYGAKLIQTPLGQQVNQRLMELRERHPNINLSPAQAHNEYVQVMAEMGILGIASVVLILSVLLWSGLKTLRTESSPYKQLMFLLLYVSAFTFIVDGVFNFPAHLPASSMNLVFLLGLAHSRYFFPQAKTIALRKWGRHGLVTLVVVMSVSISVLAYRDWQANLKMERGTAYLTSGLSSKAKEQFEESLKLDFEPSAVLYYMGLIHLEENDLPVAKDYFERSLRTRVFKDTLWKLASLEFQDQNYTQSRDYLRRLRAMFPNADVFLEVRYLEALIEIRLGNAEESIQISKDTLKDHPDFGQMYIAMGEAALSMQAYQDAYDSYREAVAYLNSLIDDILIYMNEEENVPEALVQQLHQRQFQRDEIVKILEQLSQALD